MTQPHLSFTLTILKIVFELNFFNLKCKKSEKNLSILYRRVFYLKIFYIANFKNDIIRNLQCDYDRLLIHTPMGIPLFSLNRFRRFNFEIRSCCDG
jgi:hypothetical protein